MGDLSSVWCTPTGESDRKGNGYWLIGLNTVRAAGTGEITLQRLLKAYEVTLPKYQVKAEEDIYYYRFLLKLSLDPNPNWWAKFNKEAQALLGR